ncbi:MAG TPA: polysaccharide deacetylase family protein [Acetobacteraceae bacterium]|nr:polysaccharide deacetylase family protein [Acetobacteraceae bacterium]
MPFDAERDLAELRAAAAESDAHHELIPRITWPEGVRLAVNFTADFDAMLLRRLMNETPMQLAKGEFGGRVGIWRLIELFDHHNVTATIFTPGRICELYPEAVRAAARSGHEVADHMWEHRVPKEPELERDHLTRATEALTRTAGRRPVGSRSWHTLGLMAELGYLYNSHGSAAHGPFWEHDGKGNRLLNLPFHYAIDDAMFYSFAWLGSENSAQRITDTDRVMDLWWDAFERQYREGGYLNICLHPFVSGRALRIAALDRLIARMKERPGVWFPSCEGVARHVIATHPSTRMGVH